MEIPCKHSSGHIFDLIFIKRDQDACLSNCSDEFDGSGERSRAILALLFKIISMNSSVYILILLQVMGKSLALIYYV
jgi:hypothetical protein